MNYSKRQDANANHLLFLNQLEQLASQAASVQAQIASDAAKHEFRVRFEHYLQEKMKIAAEETERGSAARSAKLYQSICSRRLQIGH